MEPELIESPAQNSNIKRWILLSPVALIVTLVFYWSWLTAPAYSDNIQFEIVKGMSARDISASAKEAGLVRAPFLLYATLSLRYDPTNIHAGRYFFSEPLTVFGVARYLASNKTELDLTKVTFPEGITITQMAEIVDETFAEITASDYLAVAGKSEGYLFPETYFVPPDISAADLVKLQKETLQNTLRDLYQENIDKSISTEYLITLASIVEREANDAQSMGMVAGIFLNRLEIGMALQADATIEYVLDEKIGELAPGELAINLREIDSLYNTYTHTGLTPTPIGNPGYMALSAVLKPTESDYFYYLTDENGDFHYARTLSEHNQNVQRYLR